MLTAAASAAPAAAVQHRRLAGADAPAQLAVTTVDDTSAPAAAPAITPTFPPSTRTAT